jgi:hypothetical protein
VSLWEIEPARAERMAKRRAEFEANKWPLFASAGFLRPTTAAQIVAGGLEKQKGWDRMQARFVRKSRLMRFLAAKHCTPEQLAQLDKRRTGCPVDPVYSCEFWRARIRERLAGEEWIEYRITQ